MSSEVNMYKLAKLPGEFGIRAAPIDSEVCPLSLHLNELHFSGLVETQCEYICWYIIFTGAIYEKCSKHEQKQNKAEVMPKAY